MCGHDEDDEDVKVHLIFDDIIPSLPAKNFITCYRTGSHPCRGFVMLQPRSLRPSQTSLDPLKPRFSEFRPCPPQSSAFSRVFLESAILTVMECYYILSFIFVLKTLSFCRQTTVASNFILTAAATLSGRNSNQEHCGVTIGVDGSLIPYSSSVIGQHTRRSG